MRSRGSLGSVLVKIPPGRNGTPAYSSGRAWRAGLLLFALELVQSLALLPLLLHWMSAEQVSFWLAVVAGAGLVNAAAAGYAQPLVRLVARRSDNGSLSLDWSHAKAWADRTGTLLLLPMQLALLVALFAGRDPLNWDSVSAAVLFCTAMHLRLRAMNRFPLLNGVGEIGRDKWMLVYAGVLSLALQIVGAAMARSLVSLALAQLVAATVLMLMASRTSEQEARKRSLPPLDRQVPTPPEVAALLLLNAAGFINASTDILIAERLMTSTDAVAYAWCARALATSTWLAGMFAQVRFPAWSTNSSRALLERDARLTVRLACMVPLLAVAGYTGARQVALLQGVTTLSLGVVAALGATAASLCCSIVLGQMSNSRGSVAFVPASIALACASPLLAWMMAAITGVSVSFVLGYTVCNVALAATNWVYAARHWK